MPQGRVSPCRRPGAGVGEWELEVLWAGRRYAMWPFPSETQAAAALGVLRAKAAQLAGESEWARRLSGLDQRWLAYIGSTGWGALLAHLAQAEGCSLEEGTIGQEEGGAGAGGGQDSEVTTQQQQPHQQRAQQESSGGAAVEGQQEVQQQEGSSAESDGRTAYEAAGAPAAAAAGPGQASAPHYLGVRPHHGHYGTALSCESSGLWLGTFDSQEAAACAFDVGAIWRALRKGGEGPGRLSIMAPCATCLKPAEPPSVGRLLA